MKLSAAALPLLVVAGVLLVQGAGFSMSGEGSSAQSGAPHSGQAAGSSTEAAYRAAAQSADAKFHRIETNAAKAQPDQTPTVFTEREINAYISTGHVQLPQGVNQVQFTGRQGVITTNASVDFDKITQNKKSANPLMSLFSGVHQVEVVSHGQGTAGQGRVHIDSVSMDGVAVPRIALEYFVDHYIKPKYPDLGLDSTFELPDRIDTATVGDHTLSVTQR